MRDRRRFDFPCIVYALRAPVWILDSERAVELGSQFGSQYPEGRSLR